MPTSLLEVMTVQGNRVAYFVSLLIDINKKPFVVNPTKRQFNYT